MIKTGKYVYKNETSMNKMQEFYNRTRSYKMELDIFFPADKVFERAEKIFKGSVKVLMLTDCIGRRFPESKVHKMRAKLEALGVQYIYVSE